MTENLNFLLLLFLFIFSWKTIYISFVKNNNYRKEVKKMRFQIKLSKLKKYELKEIKGDGNRLELQFNYKTSSFKIVIEKASKKSRKKYNLIMIHGKKKFNLTKYYLNFLVKNYKVLNLFINLKE